MPLEVVLLYSLFFAIVCGFLAPTKGRAAGPWFITGLIFGVFALAALAFVERLDDVDPETEWSPVAAPRTRAAAVADGQARAAGGSKRVLRGRDAMRRATTVLVASLLSGCAASATPRIIYVTPTPALDTPSVATAPAAPTVRPATPLPVTVVTPVPSAEATSDPVVSACAASASDVESAMQLLAAMEMKDGVEDAFPTWALAKGAAKKVPYKTFFRDNESYSGKPVYFKGKVIQAIYDAPFGGTDCQGLVDYLDGTATLLRVNVTLGSYGIYSDTVYVVYLGPKRILEDDVVDFVGMANGLQTYESVTGASITIPEVLVGTYLYLR